VPESSSVGEFEGKVAKRGYKVVTKLPVENEKPLIEKE
jgi:hypothetical protein